VLLVAPNFNSKWTSLERLKKAFSNSPHPSLQMLAKTRTFFSEVKAELQKASWPWDPQERGVKKYRELIDSTTVVIVAMLLLSGFVSLWDLVMMSLVGTLTK
jgi:preprotein translocase subunit SecE